MADLVITAANVVPGDGGVEEMNAGEVIAAGETVCKVGSDAFKADADHATAARANVYGIAVTSALAINQPVFVQKTGTVTLGASTVEKGLPYFQSGTAGKICPAADLFGGDRPCLVGYGATTSTMLLKPVPSAITVAASVVITTTVDGDGVSVNEVQTIEVRNATGGTYTLTFEGQTTAAIAYDAAAAAVDSALTALSNITAVTVTGTGTFADPYVVTFTDDFSNQDQMTATITNLLPV